MRVRRWVKVMAVALLCSGVSGICPAQELAIQSFNGAGRLTFNTLNSATNYRLECATSPSGPWSDTWAGLVAMPPVQAGSVTCSVPVFYRVVATVTNAWLVLDTAGDMAFGVVPVGHTATHTLTLMNRGGASLTVTGIDYPAGFSGDWSGVIPAGYQQVVAVTFTPLENTDYGGTLTIHSDAGGGTFTLALSGRGESDYIVIDLSEGPAASSYPVSYLAAVPGGGWSDVYKTTKLVLRLLPAATNAFTMGSPSGELGRGTDETQHAVTLSQGFYVGVFEVTQKQWERVMGTWPSFFNNASYREARPVEGVSYYDIRENPANSDDPAVNWPANSAVNTDSFMGKLRERTGLTFDLPTESQWEYACRAGTTTALNSGYNLTSTSSDARVAEVGRYYYNGGSGYTQGGNTSVGSAKAGSYLPNEWGLYDMHGNVFEWCLDYYGAYPGTVTDPKGASGGFNRVLRGGAWNYGAQPCRSAFRNGSADYVTGFDFGFRVALPVGR